jgi:hypothetical protein
LVLFIKKKNKETPKSKLPSKQPPHTQETPCPTPGLISFSPGGRQIRKRSNRLFERSEFRFDPDLGAARALKTIYSLDFWFFLSRKRIKKKFKQKKQPQGFFAPP